MRAGLVLAAGSSTRMGRPKLDLPLEGKTMSRWVAETLLAQELDRVRVVVPEGKTLDLPIDERLEVLENREADEGMASSIRRGLSGLPDEVELVAIALADLPLVRRETVRALLRAFEERRTIVFPEYRGRQGHPVLWPGEYLDELRALKGDRGAKEVLVRHRDRAYALDVADRGVCLDIDTPDDYASAMAATRTSIE